MNKGQRVALIALGCVMFGLAMALRHEVSGVWLRSAIAGLGGAILGGTLVIARRPSNGR